MLPNYLYKKNIGFYNIINDIDKDNILSLRNNQFIRNLLFSIAVILCMSLKNKRYDNYPKIKNEDFHFTNVSIRIKSQINLLPTDFIKFNEPEELKLIINDIYFHIKNNNYNNTIYWVFWILEWEKINKKNKKPWNIEKRNINVNDKYNNNELTMDFMGNYYLRI